MKTSAMTRYCWRKYAIAPVATCASNFSRMTGVPSEAAHILLVEKPGKHQSGHAPGGSHPEMQAQFVHVCVWKRFSQDNAGRYLTRRRSRGRSATSRNVRFQDVRRDGIG